MEFFFKRLEKYIDVRPSAAMTDIIVKIMVEVLTILGIVTKEIGQGKFSTSFHVDVSPKVDLRIERFFKKLIGMKDVEDALRRLDIFTQEEARMAATEVLAITRGIDDKVKDVDKKVEGVDERIQRVDMKVEDVEDKVQGVHSKVQGVDGRVKGVDDRVKGVDHKVSSVIKGDLFFYFPAPEFVLIPLLH